MIRKLIVELNRDSVYLRYAIENWECDSKEAFVILERVKKNALRLENLLRESKV